MQLRTPTFIALALGMIYSTVVYAAPPMDTECSVEHDYCGVWHDRVFHQYRQCCGDFACTAYDHLTRAVTDVGRDEGSEVLDRKIRTELTQNLVIQEQQDILQICALTVANAIKTCRQVYRLRLFVTATGEKIILTYVNMLAESR
ncbi:hypothetical protein B0H13DRAFT_1873310 [Mycena leptocephala]|nr:hypothetical protein B0H13DRAFT_1873310 [Mycena leptocephala]